MACKVTITSVTPTGPPLTAVDVTGTATVPDCTTVEVILECGGEPGPKLTGVPVDGAGNWVAHFTSNDLKTTPCRCGGSYVVTAVCEQSAQCEKGITQGEFDCEGLCPTAATLSAAVGDCTPDGYRNVTFDVALTPGTGTPLITRLDYGDGQNDGGHVWPAGQTTYTPPPTHPYVPGQQYTATLSVIYPTGCSVLATVPVGPLELCPCPDLQLPQPSVSGCAGPGNATATATFTATLTPPGANCMYHWSFGDNTHAVTTTPTTTHSYGTPSSVSASVAVTCGACVMTQGTTLDIPSCTPPPPPPPPPTGEGLSCFVARVLMTIGIILGIVIAALIACHPALWGPLTTFAVVVGVVTAVATFFWAFCDKPCAWALLLAWQVSVGAGAVLLYFSKCCAVAFWLIGLGLVAAGVTLMFVWKSHCNESDCAVVAELSIALVSVILPVLGWVGAIPVLHACVNTLVAAILSLLASVVVVKLARCAAGPAQTPGQSAQSGPPPLRDLRHPGSQI
jgi:PKD domain